MQGVEIALVLLVSRPFQVGLVLPGAEVRLFAVQA